jgi:hypothetical protein
MLSKTMAADHVTGHLSSTTDRAPGSASQKPCEVLDEVEVHASLFEPSEPFAQPSDPSTSQRPPDRHSLAAVSVADALDAANIYILCAPGDEAYDINYLRRSRTKNATMPAAMSLPPTSVKPAAQRLECVDDGGVWYVWMWRATVSICIPVPAGAGWSSKSPGAPCRARVAH